MTGAFSVEVLSEKLSKLNASQQSIETLSHWCIYHRKRAKHIVKAWEKEFFSAPKEKRVLFLYLANDIIQNSRRKGSEFVLEFWKVLRNCLKDVKENGDENGRNAVSRLVSIWEERKVFGSRAQSLKETLLGNNPVPELEIPDKEKKEKKDKDKEKEKEKPAASSSFIKIKLDGSILEKVVKAFQDVNDGVTNEEAAIEECNSIRRRIEALNKEAAAHGQENEHATALRDELQQQRSNLSQLVEQLEISERNRSKLVSLLRESLNQQEKKLEHVKNQLQGFRSPPETIPKQTLTPAVLPPVVQTMASIDDGSRKSKETTPPTAAEFAAKLAASSSSAAMLSSIFSSLTPEELGFHSNKRAKFSDSKSSDQFTDYHLPPPPPPLPPPPPPPAFSQTAFLGGAANLVMPYSYPVPPGQPLPVHHVAPTQQQQIAPLPSPPAPPQLAPLPPAPPLPPGCAPTSTYHPLQVPPGINYYPPAR